MTVALPTKIHLDEKFDRIDEHWRPRVAASLNGQELKLVKIQGEFPWHHHEHEDEMFLVWRGSIRLEFRDGSVALGPGEALVVPKGVEHRPVAKEEAEVLLFEPSGVRNTGNVEDEAYTAPQGATI
ncbi:MAG: cupin domain-containing protein [Pseudomonadota bacterium]